MWFSFWLVAKVSQHKYPYCFEQNIEIFWEKKTCAWNWYRTSPDLAKWCGYDPIWTRIHNSAWSLKDLSLQLFSLCLDIYQNIRHVLFRKTKDKSVSFFWKCERWNLFEPRNANSYRLPISRRKSKRRKNLLQIFSKREPLLSRVL